MLLCVRFTVIFQSLVFCLIRKMGQWAKNSLVSDKTLLTLMSQCLKFTEKVAFNIAASEASYFTTQAIKGKTWSKIVVDKSRDRI